MGSAHSAGANANVEFDNSAAAGKHGNVPNWLCWSAWNAPDGSHALPAEGVLAWYNMFGRHPAGPNHTDLHGAQRVLLWKSHLPGRHLSDLRHGFSRRDEVQRSSSCVPEALYGWSGISGRLHLLQMHDGQQRLLRYLGFFAGCTS